MGTVWNLGAKLGEGGIGEVYLATSPEGRQVALKLLKLKSNEELEGFKREAKLLLRLRHPAIAELLGFETSSEKMFGSNRGPCFWMEYVEGGGLLSAARFAQPEQIFAWLGEALEALAELHGQSILHNDLSPNNVLVTPQGRVKLLDFGLATAWGERSALRAGTLPYLAPERFAGNASPASDLFSLGTIFYEALAGRHPRATARSLHEMSRIEPPPLADQVPRVAADYALETRVIDRMIQARTEQRFASAQDVLETLRRRPAASPEPGAAYHSAQFYGVERCLQGFEDAKRLVASQSKIYWLHGITGVGKTRLVRELALQLAVQGFAVAEIESGDAVAAIREIRQGPAPGNRAYFFKDLHSLDVELLSAIATLRRVGIPHPGSLIFFEWNDDRLGEAGRRFFDEMRSEGGKDDILLKNLEPEQTRQLLSSALGDAAGSEVAETLQRQTGGNPRMLLELVAMIRERGGAGKKYFTREDLQALGGLTNFESIAAFRYDGLGDSEKDVLAWIAAADGEVELPWLAAVADATDVAMSGLLRRGMLCGDRRVSLSFPALRNAIRARDGEPRWKERQENWYQSLPEEPQAMANKLRLAIGLGKSEFLESHARIAAEQMEAAGNFTEALEILEGAIPLVTSDAERSRLLRAFSNLLQRVNRFEDALAAAERSFALKAEDEPWLLKQTKYYFVTGLLHQHLGHFAEAVQRLQQCLSLEVDPAGSPFRIRALTLLGMEKKREGSLAEARDSLSAALQLDPRGRRRAEIFRNLGIISGAEKKWAEAQTDFREAARLYHEESYVIGEISTWLEEGNQALHNDRAAEAEASYRQAARIAEQNDLELQLAIAWNNLGILQRKRGRLDEALENLGKAESIFRALGHGNNLGEHLVQHAIARAATGQFERATAMLRELAGLSEHAPFLATGIAGAQAFLCELQTGVTGLIEALSSDESRAWNLEAALRDWQREAATAAMIRDRLSGMFRSLSVKLQVSFAERFDYRKYVLGKIPEAVEHPKENDMNLIESLSAISRDLIRENNMERVLLRLMDAAIEISGAENGFLLLKSESGEGPIPGFSVEVARNIKKEMLEKLDFAISLSAIRQAMETGEPVVTDNALADPRFSQAKSVQLHELKSILALPVVGDSGLLGVFYLDHRFEMGIFPEEKLSGLRAFADQAALALQKGRMIEELRRANSSLSVQVEEQGEQLSAMEKELKQSRLKLKHEYSEIVGRSPKMIQVLGLVDKITNSKIPVWIFGESGTGKESIARALHFNSSRTKQPFVSENCSALPETLLESELFGHKRGAFTHADRDKKGILQYADKGTIFLDEIADMSLNLQAKLLRFLQEGEIRPLGSNDVLKVDVRVVSASNKDLPEMVAAGKFREDLFFRLNGITVTLPSLRERKEDVPLLVSHFLKRVASRENAKPCRIHPDALRVLMDYPWPGNIRELQNTIETAVLFAENGVVNTKSLQFKPQVFNKYKSVKSSGFAGGEVDTLEPELEGILRALRDQGFHKGNAARALGISRRNLYVKLEKYKIPIDLAELKKFIDKRVQS